PLRINRSIPFADCDPSTFARGNAGTLVRFFEPRHDTRRFRSMTGGCLVIVGKRAIKRILSRRKFHRKVVDPVGGIWVVKTAVIPGPIFVPGAPPVRHGIISARPLADPKDRCHNIFLPRIALSCGWGTVLSVYTACDDC